MESLDLASLAVYLRRDARDLARLAEKGELPGRRVGGAWRFNRAEVHEWIERSMSEWDDRALEGVEQATRPEETSEWEDEENPEWQEEGLLVSRYLTEDTIALPIDGRTVPSVLNQLVRLANAGWQVFLPDEILAAVRAREELCSTAMPGGVAVPHPRRPIPNSLGETVIAFGRTTRRIPFGSRGETTDLFFLLLAMDEREHLRLLARLARLFGQPEFLEGLRAIETPRECLHYIREAELALPTN